MTAALPQFQRTQGSGRIGTKRVGDRTRIDTLYQQGASKIRIPDAPWDPGLEAVIINTAGGVTGGDDLAWHAEAGAGTDLTVTTQACEKVYKADTGTAEVTVHLSVAQGASLHWLPQETILFDRSNLTRSIHADIADDATLLLVEPVILGRRAMGETFTHGRWRDHWRIHHNGQLIHAENVHLHAPFADHLVDPAGLDGHTALVTMLLVGNHAEAKLEGARAMMQNQPDVVAGASHWQVAGQSGATDKLVIRMLAPDGYALRHAMIPLINHLASSPDRQTHVPKIWSL